MYIYDYRARTYALDNSKTDTITSMAVDFMSEAVVLGLANQQVGLVLSFAVAFLSSPDRHTVQCSDVQCSAVMCSAVQ